MAEAADGGAVRVYGEREYGDSESERATSHRWAALATTRSEWRTSGIERSGNDRLTTRVRIIIV